LVESSLIGLIIRIGVAIVAFWLTGWFLVRIISAAGRRAGVPQGQLRLLSEGIRTVFIVLSVIAFANLAGLTSEFTALTISGIVAIALSLALQTTLTNVISGFLVLLDNTLTIHDFIQYSGIKGEVIKLGLRNIWIKTEEGNLVIVSNRQIADGPLINYTAGERLMKKL